MDGLPATDGTRHATTAIRKFDQLICTSKDVVYTQYPYSEPTVLEPSDKTYDVDFVIDILEPLSKKTKNTSVHKKCLKNPLGW